MPNVTSPPPLPHLLWYVVGLHTYYYSMKQEKEFHEWQNLRTALTIIVVKHALFAMTTHVCPIYIFLAVHYNYMYFICFIYFFGQDPFSLWFSVGKTKPANFVAFTCMAVGVQRFPLVFGVCKSASSRAQACDVFWKHNDNASSSLSSPSVNYIHCLGRMFRLISFPQSKIFESLGLNGWKVQ